MSLVELDEETAGRLKPGDTVLVRGVVVKALPGVGVLVELLSKTDQYETWVRLDLVDRLVLADVPDEPADGTWLVGPNDDAVDGGINVYHRNDADAPDEPERRRPRRWQVAGTGEWLDWPTVVARGADPRRALTAPAVSLSPVDPTRQQVRDAIVSYLEGVIAGTVRQITKGVRHRFRGGVTEQEVEEEVRALVEAGDVRPAESRQHQIAERWELIRPATRTAPHREEGA